MKLLTLLVLSAAVAAGQSRFARLGELQGTVEVQLTAADPWMAAERNLPLEESAWVRTGGGARVEIEMDDGSDWRLGADSQGEISDYKRLSTGQRVTLLSLDHGTAYFSGQPAGKDAVMIVMPGAMVTVTQGSRVRLTVAGPTSWVAVLEGQVRFSSPAVEIDLHENTTARVDPAIPSRFNLAPEVAADPLDRWNEERDKALGSAGSAVHVTAHYGLADLDTAGKWVPSEDLGPVWKPDVAADWTPYQNGHWRYYESLGYAWVSGEAWGWLPYHNGRWAQREKLGWVWQPAVSTVFHPGDVYWQRGPGFVGWGPLAPGEAAPAVGAPQGYASGATMYAAFQPDLRVIAADGFPKPTADQLKGATFVTAPPSPAFLVSRLDAVRPMVRAGSTRVMPSVYGVTFGDGPPPVDSSAEAPAPPVARPLVIVTQAPTPQAPPSEPVYPLPAVAVEVVGIPVVVNPPKDSVGAQPVKQVAVNTAKAPSTTTTPPGAPPSRERPTAPPRTPPKAPPTKTGAVGMTPEEAELLRAVQKDVDAPAPNYPKALADLNAWSRQFPNTAWLNDRMFYYVHTYDNLGKPAQVLESAERVVMAGVRESYRDPQEALQVLMAATSNVQKIANPTAVQLTIGRNAAQQLLDFLPIYFDPPHRPSGVPDANWQKARRELETMARQVLTKRPAGRSGMQ